MWRNEEALYPLEDAPWERRERWVDDNGNLDAGYYLMVKKKKETEPKTVRLPKFFCQYCQEPVDPTEDSLRRILVRGVKNACPFYICDCTPTELQVHPGWHKVQLEPR